MKEVPTIRPDVARANVKMSEKLKETLGIVDEMQNIIHEEYVDVEALKTEIELQMEREANAVALPGQSSFIIPKVPTNVISSETEMNDVKQDYSFSRDLHYYLTDTLGTALTSAVKLAQDTEHPKAFETVNSLSKTLLEVAGSLMSIQKNYADITEESVAISRAQNVTNIQVNAGSAVASTDDILNMLEDFSKKDKQKSEPFVEQSKTIEYVKDGEVEIITEKKNRGRPRKNS